MSKIKGLKDGISRSSVQHAFQHGRHACPRFVSVNSSIPAKDEDLMDQSSNILLREAHEGRSRDGGEAKEDSYRAQWTACLITIIPGSFRGSFRLACSEDMAAAGIHMGHQTPPLLLPMLSPKVRIIHGQSQQG